MPGSNKENSEDQPSLEELLTLSEAAKRSGLTQEHLAYLVRKGELWINKIGSPIWFTTEKAVREYLARDRKPGPKPKNDG